MHKLHPMLEVDPSKLKRGFRLCKFIPYNLQIMVVHLDSKIALPEITIEKAVIGQTDVMTEVERGSGMTIVIRGTNIRMVRILKG